MVWARVTIGLPVRQRTQLLSEYITLSQIFVAVLCLCCSLQQVTAARPEFSSFLQHRALQQYDCNTVGQYAYLRVRVSDFAAGFTANDAFRIFAAAVAKEGITSDCATILNVSTCVPSTPGGTIALEREGSGCSAGTITCSPKKYYHHDVRVLSAICDDDCVQWPGLRFAFCAGNVPVDLETYTRTKELFCENKCFQKQNYTAQCLATLNSQMKKCFNIRVKFGLPGTASFQGLQDAVLNAIWKMNNEPNASFKMSLQSFAGGEAALKRPFLLDVGRANSTTFWPIRESPDVDPSHFLHGTTPQLHLGEWTLCPTTCGVSWRTRPSYCEAQPGLLDRQVNCANASVVQSYEMCASATNCSQYEWQTSPWSDCSQKCDSGFATRKARCVDVNGTVVNDTMCTARKPPLTTACNMGPCISHVWLVGNWTTCSASCGGGYSTRPMLCVDSHNNTKPANFCGPQPKNFTLCNVHSCGHCDHKDCSGHGQCKKGICACDEGWKGFNCEVPRSCKSYMVDKRNKCCNSGIVDAEGRCHEIKGRLDVDGKFCPEFKKLDACGKCDGRAQVVDNKGTCTARAIDASGNACKDGVDDCGVCGGLGNTCALVISVEVQATPRNDVKNPEFAKALIPRMLALAGAAPRGKDKTNVLITDRGWTLKNISVITTVFDTVLYPPFLYSTNASISVGSTQLRMAQMLPWSFPFKGLRAVITSPVMVNRRGVCGNGICEIGERPLFGYDTPLHQPENGTFSPTEPFMPCDVDCPMPYWPCPKRGGKICGGNGYCTGNDVCNCFKGYTGLDCGRCDVGFKNFGQQCVYDAARQNLLRELYPTIIAKMHPRHEKVDIVDLLPKIPRPGVHIGLPADHGLTARPPVSNTLPTITDTSNYSLPPEPPRKQGILHRMTNFVKKNYIAFTAALVGFLLLVLILTMFVYRRRTVAGYAHKGDKNEPVKCLAQLKWRKRLQWSRTGKKGRKPRGLDRDVDLVGPSPPLLEKKAEGVVNGNLIVVIDSKKNIGPAESLLKARDKMKQAEEEDASVSPQIQAVQQVAHENRQGNIEPTSHVLEPPVTSLATSGTASTVFYSPRSESQTESPTGSANSFTKAMQQTGSFIANQWKSQQKFLALVRNPDGAEDYQHAQREASWDMGLSNKLWNLLMPPQAMDWREEAAAEKKLSEEEAMLSIVREEQAAGEEVEMTALEAQPSTQDHEYSALLQHRVVALPAISSEIQPADDESPTKHNKPRQDGRNPLSPGVNAALNTYRSPLETGSSQESQALATSSNTAIVCAPPPPTSKPATILADVSEPIPVKQEAHTEEVDDATAAAGGIAARLTRSTHRLLNLRLKGGQSATDSTSYTNVPSASPVKPKAQPEEEVGTPSPAPPSTPSPACTPDTSAAPSPAQPVPASSPVPNSPLQDSIALGRQVAMRCSLSPSASVNELPTQKSNPGSPTAAHAAGGRSRDASPSILARKRSVEPSGGVTGGSPGDDKSALHGAFTDEPIHDEAASEAGSAAKPSYPPVSAGRWLSPGKKRTTPAGLVVDVQHSSFDEASRMGHASVAMGVLGSPVPVSMESPHVMVMQTPGSVVSSARSGSTTGQASAMTDMVSDVDSKLQRPAAVTPSSPEDMVIIETPATSHAGSTARAALRAAAAATPSPSRDAKTVMSAARELLSRMSPNTADSATPGSNFKNVSLNSTPSSNHSHGSSPSGALYNPFHVPGTAYSSPNGSVLMTDPKTGATQLYSGTPARDLPANMMMTPSTNGSVSTSHEPVNPFSPVASNIFAANADANPFEPQPAPAPAGQNISVFDPAMILRNSSARENTLPSPPLSERRPGTDNPFLDVTNLEHAGGPLSPSNPFRPQADNATTNLPSPGRTSPFVTNGGNPFLTSVEIQQLQLRQGTSPVPPVAPVPPGVAAAVRQSSTAADASVDMEQSRLALMLDAAAHGDSFDRAVVAAETRVLSRNVQGDELTALADADSMADEQEVGVQEVREVPVLSPKRERPTWQVPSVPATNAHAGFSPASSTSASPQLDRNNPLWSQDQANSSSLGAAQSTMNNGPLPQWVEHPADEAKAERDADEVTSTSSVPVPKEDPNMSFAGWNSTQPAQPTNSASSLTTALTGLVYGETVADDATSLTPAMSMELADSQAATKYYTPGPHSGQHTGGSPAPVASPGLSEATSGMSAQPVTGSPVDMPSAAESTPPKSAHTRADSHQSDTVRYESSSEVPGDVMERVDAGEMTSRRESVAAEWQQQPAASQQLPPDQAFKIMAADLLNNMKAGQQESLPDAQHLGEILQVETSGFSATLPLPPSGEMGMAAQKFLADLLKDDSVTAEHSIHSNGMNDIDSLTSDAAGEIKALVAANAQPEPELKLPEKVKTSAPRSAAAALALARAVRAVRPAGAADKAKQRLAAEAKSFRVSPGQKKAETTPDRPTRGASGSTRSSPLDVAKAAVKGVLSTKPDPSPERMTRGAGMLSSVKKSPARDGPFKSSPLTATNLKVSPAKTVATKLASGYAAVSSALTPQKDRPILAPGSSSKSEGSAPPSVNKSPSRLFAPTQSFLNKMASPPQQR